MHTVLNLYISLSRTCVFKKSVEYYQQIDVEIDTMIEVPRAAVTAIEVAHEADFFSFGSYSNKAYQYKKSPCYIAGALIYYLVLDHD